jgi:hypothetical protein
MARLLSMKHNVIKALCCLAMILLLPVNANALLLGTSVNVSFNSTVNPTAADTVTVTPNQEIIGEPAPPQPIMDIGVNTLFLGEFIDITDTSIIYHLMGGGLALSNNSNYLSPGFASGDFFKFDNLIYLANPNNAISSVGIILNNVINVDLTNDVSFTAHSVQLNLDRLGVFFVNDGLPDFGTITLNLQFQSVNPPPPQVPEPESLLLIGIGMLIFALRNRRAMV